MRFAWIVVLAFVPLVLMTSELLAFDRAGDRHDLSSDKLSISEKDAINESEKDRCMLEILSDKTVKNFFGVLNIQFLSQEQKTSLLNIHDYCSCVIEKNHENLKLKQKDEIAYRFRDQAGELSNNDQCSLRYLPEDMRELVFSINLRKIQSTLQDKLDERSPASVSIIVNQDSLQQNLYCVQNLILFQCSRIPSLHSTFKCIQESTTNSQELMRFKNLCPQLVTADESTPVELSTIPNL